MRANDGSTPPRTFLPGTSEPGVWHPTPPGFGPGILLHWRNVVPFGIKSSDQFRSDPPPALSSETYARDYNEVMAIKRLDGILGHSRRQHYGHAAAARRVVRRLSAQ